MTSIMSFVSRGFIPAAGSSRRRSTGSDAIARATSRRRWSPYGRLRATVLLALQADEAQEVLGAFVASTSSRRFRGVERNASRSSCSAACASR